MIFRTGSRTAWRAASFAAVTISLTGCGDSNTSSEEAIATFSLTSSAGINTYAVVPDQLRLAAAQSFRQVSVAAFANPLSRLRRDVRSALYAEKGVHRTLGPKAQRQILPYLAKLDEAAQRGDRARVADCARESFRLIAEDMSPAAGKQAAFAILDYSQLAASAALLQPQADWASVDAALKLAEPRRLALASQADHRERQELDKDFTYLATAVRQRDRSAAIQALRGLRRTFDAYRSAFDGPLPDQALATSSRDES